MKKIINECGINGSGKGIVNTNTEDFQELKNKILNHNKQKLWYLYIVECSDNSLYTGITTDLNRRITEHNSSNKGAKYTRPRRPVTLVYSEIHPNRSAASKSEYKIKQLSKQKKLSLIQNETNKNKRSNS